MIATVEFLLEFLVFLLAGKEVVEGRGPVRPLLLLVDATSSKCISSLLPTSKDSVSESRSNGEGVVEETGVDSARGGDLILFALMFFVPDPST